MGKWLTKLHTNDDENRIRQWLDFIGESNPDVIAEVLEKCGSDSEAMEYYLGRSEEVNGEAVEPQGRHTQNLGGDAGLRGGLRDKYE